MIALYTKLFSTFLAENPTFLTNVITMSTADKSTALISAIKARWNLYEICDTDGTTDGSGDSDFKEYFKEAFDRFKPYYEEMISNYSKAYDYATGNKKTNTSHTANAGTGTSSDSETDTGFALPNKLGGAEYPTTKKTLSTSGNSGTNGTADSNSETIYNDEFIQLKIEYMAQIRDLYYEFAGQFAPCFIHLLS